MLTISNRRTDRLLEFKFNEKYLHIKPEDYLEIFQKPDWYLELKDMLDEFFWSYDGKEKKSKEWLTKRKEIVKMVEELLKANLIALGSEGKNHDVGRKPVDTIIIHHSSTSPTASLTYINALCLLRLYAKTYSNEENSEYGRPLWSNHLKEGRQTFIPYHYIIRRDGTFEKILEDGMMGWHAGNWGMNCKSIAICFLDDLEKNKPTENALKTAAMLIKKYNPKQVLGHKEINLNTTCPGKSFSEWKFALLNLVST